MNVRPVVLCLVAAGLAFALRETPQAGRGLIRILVAPRTSRAAAILAEVAADPDARARGLGGRETLPVDGGMLFVYPTDEPRGYWMKDCRIPLDIAFVGGDRRILNVASLPAAAGLPDEAIPRAQSRGPARYVLETNSGWFSAHRIVAGDELEFLASVEPQPPR